jgi:hypothetical protein
VGSTGAGGGGGGGGGGGATGAGVAFFTAFFFGAAFFAVFLGAAFLATFFAAFLGAARNKGVASPSKVSNNSFIRTSLGMWGKFQVCPPVNGDDNTPSCVYERTVKSNWVSRFCACQAPPLRDTAIEMFERSITHIARIFKPFAAFYSRIDVTTQPPCHFERSKKSRLHSTNEISRCKQRTLK